MACAPLLTEDDLLRFRTKACLRLAQGSCSFGLDRCQYCHSSVWTRRPPFFPLGAYHQQRNSGHDRHPTTVALLRYLPVACSNVIVSDGSITAVPCPRGQNCPFSHSRDEIVYHPLLYKTEECEDYETSRCGVYYCWKTHNAKERRKPPKLKLGLVKGIEVQVFYPGITVVQVNAPGQKSTCGSGKLSEVLKGCVGGQGKAVSRRARGGPSKKDYQQVASNCLFTCRNLMKNAANFPSAGESAFASIYGASAPMHMRQPPPPPARSSSFACDNIGVAWDDRRQMVDSSALMEFVTAEASVRVADFQDLEHVIRGSVNDKGSEKCQRMIAEVLRRSNATPGTNADISARAPPAEEDESAYRCATIGNTAAFIAMMVLQANKVLATKGETANGDYRIEENYGKKLAELGSEEGSAGRDVLGYLGSAVVSPSPYSSTVQGDESCMEMGHLTSDHSYAVTRANSEGELPLSSSFRRSQQGSEQSYSRSLSTSRKSADSTCEGTAAIMGSNYKHEMTEDEGMPSVEMACCGGEWIQRACESGAHAWSDTSSDDPAAGEYGHARALPPKPHSPFLEPVTGNLAGFQASHVYTDSVMDSGPSPADLFTPSTSILVDSSRESAADITSLPFHLRIFSDRDRGKGYGVREDGDAAEPHHSKLNGDRRKVAFSELRASGGLAGDHEISPVQELLAQQHARDGGVGTAACSVPIMHGQHDDGGTGEVGECRGCLEEAGTRLRQAVNALDLIREGQAGKLRKDLLMHVAKELLELVADGETQTTSQTQSQAWYPTGAPFELLPRVRTSDDAEGHSVMMAGLLSPSSSAPGAGAPWSSAAKKRVDGPSPVMDVSHNTVW
ncbi:hypothetical protein BESB_001280 [Besnoitia besnoiti]|uniref:C3H1-type domain-containing protein n=1 Tax=Besnoitia besnoiti TaxID=94643 RepID=A0A2A9MNI8_BESBE|nr:hypothetical protein BESB_001280 [Besnoitia besnoiti]PFH37786.1 hypothetical protein BESB_001280 [Besnoitia besnoiti]